MNANVSEKGSGAPAICKQSTNKDCHGWQQGAYLSNGLAPGKVVIQYWLFSYRNAVTTDCPPGGWRPSRKFGDSGPDTACYMDASQICKGQSQKSSCYGKVKKVPATTVEQFKTMHLTMHAGDAGPDRVILRIGGKLHAKTQHGPEKWENLNRWWKQAEVQRRRQLHEYGRLQ